MFPGEHVLSIILLSGMGCAAASAESVSLPAVPDAAAESSVVDPSRLPDPTPGAAPVNYLQHICAVREIYYGAVLAEESEMTAPEATTILNAFNALYRFTGLIP